MDEKSLKSFLEETKVRDTKSVNAEGVVVTHTFADGNGLGVFDKDAIDGSYSKGWDNLIPSVGKLYTDLKARIARNKA